MGIVRSTAEQPVFKLDGHAFGLEAFEDAYRLTNDFRANAVTGENENFHERTQSR